MLLYFRHPFLIFSVSTGGIPQDGGPPEGQITFDRPEPHKRSQDSSAANSMNVTAGSRSIMVGEESLQKEVRSRHQKQDMMLSPMMPTPLQHSNSYSHKHSSHDRSDPIQVTYCSLGSFKF